MGLTFEEDGHEYRFNGLVVPSVTRILAPLSDFGSICFGAAGARTLRVPFAVLEFARQRGKAVHEMIALHHNDDLDEDDLDPVLGPYLAGWKLFLYETDFVPEVWEQPVYHPRLGYAGTFDVIGILNKKRVIIDYKSSYTVPASVGPQLAAYQQAWNVANGIAVLHRYSLHLPGDGGYRRDQHTNPAAWPVFQACKAIFDWRKNA